MADDLFRADLDLRVTEMVHTQVRSFGAPVKAWACSRCHSIVIHQDGHRRWHRAVDSTSTVVQGTPSERAKQ